MSNIEHFKIIDGFGSYANETMECSVFRAIGALAHKYYMLFQHHLSPGNVDDSMQDTYIADTIPEPQYVLGPRPGPYIRAQSHNIFTRLGARIAFLGVDARTEPLTWVENVFEGSAGRSFQRLSDKLGIGKNAMNPFDNAIELLDDLNDHYTSNAHRNERRYLIERIQCVCAAHSVRATILSGDVHLAAVGRFFTTHKGDILPIEEDFRFINNVISSAIVNQPPPETMAKLIAHGDKIRHLNAETEECLFKLFRSNSTTSAKKPEGTTVAMPRRNFSIITENSPNNEGHIAASNQHGKGNDGSLDVCFCVEADHQRHDGQTVGYGFTIPALEYRGPALSEPVWSETTS
ncbi:hypothetical protein OAory_01046060 [Aspergillus oryzae]|uniref:PhoD-like phosphatase domain-containing protein n=1 Tax=Aspergillus oryzae TaxID=5062 RepID=A0A1S9DGQ1_ASPOZ|nr:hypothetical protein OAory_01046060 [Aspergillus oryzae]